MAVLTNTMMQGTAADTGDGDDYQIEKSVRFYQENNLVSSCFSKPVKNGDTRNFTFSAWVKNTGSGYGYILSNQDNATGRGFSFGFQNDDTLWIGDNDGSNTIHLKTTRKFRDPSAWYHLVLIVDTRNIKAQGSTRLYINGKQEFDFSSETYIGQNHQTRLLTTAHSADEDILVVGKMGGSSYGLNGYMADVFLFDGISVDCSAFGKFDSTGVWVAKNPYNADGEFVITAPNANTTWSSGTITNAHSSYPVTKAFNGSISDGWGAADAIWNNAGLSTFTPSNKIECIRAIRIYASAAGHDPLDPYWYVTTADANGIETRTKYEATVQTSGGNTKWYDVLTGKGELKKIEISHGTPGALVMVRAIEVDGVILVDGQTDQTFEEWRTSDKINKGEIWSTGVTAESGSFYGSNVAANLFDGRTFNTGSATSNVDDSSASKWVKWTASSPIHFSSKVEVAVASNGNTISLKRVGVGSTDDITTSGSPAWHTVYSGSGHIEYITNQAVSGGYNNWEGIRVDGVILKDWGHNINSFHLKFNDVSTGERLSWDSLSKEGTILEPVKTGQSTSGYWNDPNKSSLVFAMPGTDLLDHHHTIKGSGSAKTVTVNGTFVSSDQSHLYDRALYFDGSNDTLVVADQSDLEFHADFTFEGWFMRTGSGRAAFMAQTVADATANRWRLEINNSDEWMFYDGGNGYQYIDASDASKALNTWTHLAVTRSGSTAYFFENGNLLHSWTSNTDLGDGADLYIGNLEGGTDLLEGYAQDIRLYKDYCKYTTNFLPPSRNDFSSTQMVAKTGSGVTTGGSWNTGFRDGNGGSWDAADVHQISSGATLSTNGNANRLYIDTASLGDGYELTITDTGGANAIYFAEQDDEDPSSTSNWSNIQNNITKIVLTAGRIANMDGTIKTHKRYLRCEGAGGGHCTMTITGTLDLPFNTATSVTSVDSFVDSPTNYGTDTGAGGEVQGNYCTINSLDHGASAEAVLTQGNLTINSGSSNWKCYRGTMGVSAGKWYYEVYWNGGGEGADFGIIGADKQLDLNSIEGNGGWQFAFKHRDLGAGAADVDDYFPSGPAQNKAGWWGVAIDMDAGKLWAHYQGTWGSNGGVGDPAAGTYAGATNLSGTVCPAWSGYYNGEASFNFGQRPWKYTCPDGFQAWCTANLDDTFSGVELNNPSKYFDVLTWAGDGTTGRDIKGFNFGPDFVWIKNRNGTNWHKAFDPIRGVGKPLHQNENNAEATEATTLTAFNSDGFELGNSSTVNDATGTYIGYGWDAGTAAATASTEGSITPSAQWVNNTAGFSITKWEGTGAAATIGHGLSVKPDFAIIKNMDSAQTWAVWHKNLSNQTTKYLRLDDSAAETNSASIWYNTTAFTNTTLQVATNHSTNKDTEDHIMYAWTAINGYSAFGSYSDDVFVYTGFKPKFLLIKARTSNQDWWLLDGARDTYNVAKHVLKPDSNSAEATNVDTLDFVSNGFRIRTSSYEVGDDGNTYIFAAFAEHPFKLARAS